MKSLVSEARGEIEKEGKVLVIKRIHVVLVVDGDESDRETIERVHGVFADSCPVYRSITPSIDVTTTWRFAG